MNAFASECSSGCESGWTLYLEQSFLNQNTASMRDSRFYKKVNHKDDAVEETKEEEDLSMVSDASSGPPHFPDEEAYFSSKPEENLGNTNKKKRQKVRENQHLLSLLDDTASSPVFDFSKNNNISVTNQQGSTESVVDYSQGFSATYFEERSSFHDHFGFMESSISQNELHHQNNHRWFGGI